MTSITFRVNLELLRDEAVGSKLNQRDVGMLHPDQHQTSPDNGRAETSNRKNTRSTWIPGQLVGENRPLKHGDTFTAYGERAIYIRDQYAVGWTPQGMQQLPPADRRFLEVVS